MKIIASIVTLGILALGSESRAEGIVIDSNATMVHSMGDIGGLGALYDSDMSWTLTLNDVQYEAMSNEDAVGQAIRAESFDLVFSGPNADWLNSEVAQKLATDQGAFVRFLIDSEGRAGVELELVPSDTENGIAFSVEAWDDLGNITPMAFDDSGALVVSDYNTPADAAASFQNIQGDESGSLSGHGDVFSMTVIRDEAPMFMAAIGHGNKSVTQDVDSNSNVAGSAQEAGGCSQTPGASLFGLLISMFFMMRYGRSSSSK